MKKNTQERGLSGLSCRSPSRRIVYAAQLSLALVSAFAVAAALAAHAQTSAPHPSFEVLTHRMDVDVDGAPNAYGPPGKPTLDVLINAHYRERADQKIVGYLLDDKQRPILQSPQDPFPGYYISQTAFADVANPNERDPRSYVDARKINYVVRGKKPADAALRSATSWLSTRRRPVRPSSLSSATPATQPATRAPCICYKNWATPFTTV